MHENKKVEKMIQICSLAGRRFGKVDLSHQKGISKGKKLGLDLALVICKLITLGDLFLSNNYVMVMISCIPLRLRVEPKGKIIF